MLAQSQAKNIAPRILVEIWRRSNAALPRRQCPVPPVRAPYHHFFICGGAGENHLKLMPSLFALPA